MDGPSLVILKHPQAVLHGEDLVVHASVVPVLVSQVIKTLSELSNELVLLR